MRVGALSLFARTNSARSFNIAAYHSRHSLTWSWIVSVSFDGTWRKPGGGLRFGLSPYTTNGGPQLVVMLPFAVFHHHRQEPMWYRDLYYRARDKREALERANNALRHQLTMARALAVVEPAGGVQ